MRGRLDVIAADGSQPVAQAQLPPYERLDVSLDDRPPATLIPQGRPSAQAGQALGVSLPSDWDEEALRLLSPQEAFTALRADPAYDGLSDADLWNVIALAWRETASAESLQTGEALFAQNCAACHGQQGQGDGPAARYLTDPPPADFSDPARMAAASGVILHGKLVRGGMGTGMPYWGPIFTETLRLPIALAQDHEEETIMPDASPEHTKVPHHLRTSFSALFAEPPFLALGLSLAANLLLLYLLIFQQSTTFTVFFASNTALYNWLSIALTVLISLLAGLAMAQAAYIARNQLALRRVQGVGRGSLGAALGAIATGCPVCGATLLPMLGIAGSLAAFPLQGLEIKLLSLVILGDAIWESSRTIAGVCEISDERMFEWNEERILVRFNRRILDRLRPALLIAFAILAAYLLPSLPAQFRLSFAAAGSRYHRDSCQ
jgi:hypothetical protein